MLRSFALALALALVLTLPATAGKRPNILFAIADDQSFPHAGAYGCEWVATPNFDRIGREGLLFLNCYTPNAKCAPSRAAVVTGRNPWQLEEAANHQIRFPAKFTSFMELLRDKTDYFVGFTGKGVEPVLAPGRQLTGAPFQDARLRPPAGGINRCDYAGNFREFLKARPDGAPFCFWYGGHEPHRPYEFGSGLKKGSMRTEQIDRVPAYWPDNPTVRNDMLDYTYEIGHFDDQLGQMIALLEDAGELDNTLIVVTSDNGMPFPRAKGIEYEISNHLPLAIRWGDGIRKPGRVIEDFVSFIDFAPTFLELAGVADPVDRGMQPITGSSLRPIFDSERDGRVVPARDHVLLGQERHDIGRPQDVGYPVRSLVRDGYLYVHNFKPERWPMGNPETGYPNTDTSPTKTEVLDSRRRGENANYWELCFAPRGSEELYLLGSDPDCVQNLATDPDQAGRLTTMREFLFSTLKDQGDPRMFGKGDFFDQVEVPANLRHFYERTIDGSLDPASVGWIGKGDPEPVPAP